MRTFDLSEYINGLRTLLVSDKKRIGFFLGAGINLSKKNKDTVTISSIIELTENVTKKIDEDKFKNAIKEIVTEIGEINFNIELLLSLLYAKIYAIGNGNLNGLNKHEFDELIIKIKININEEISVHKKKFLLGDQPHHDFALWIKNAERKYPIEIFTTNYDYLIEMALENNSIPFFDGFSGSYEPFFCSDLVEDFQHLPNQTKLWKLHGSLGWYYEENKKKIIKTKDEKENLLIYPSHLKYSESKKMPYEALIDRLYNFVKQDDVLLIVSGYSFGDEHLNERLISGINRSSNSSIIAFLYDENFNEECKLANIAIENTKISVYSTRNAVIGGAYGDWKLRKEPSKDGTIDVNLYFDEDAPNMNEEIGAENIGDEKWTGCGNLKITDFNNLVNFLLSMINK